MSASKNTSKNTSKMSSSKPDERHNVKFIVKRPAGQLMMMLDTSLNQVGAFSRAINDAYDLFLHLTQDIPESDKEMKYLTLNMIDLRKICKHKGDEEETLMITLLRAIMTPYFEIESLGFPLDKNGDVINDDTLYIDIKRK